jgi:hypothetical protein
MSTAGGPLEVALNGRLFPADDMEDDDKTNQRAQKPCSSQRRCANRGERRSAEQGGAVIERGARAFIEVGLALAQVRDRRLYREQFPTFEAYCRTRLGLGHSHSYRLIEEAQAIVELQADSSPIGDKLANEAQARELARVPRELRGQVLRLAMELAEGGELTARIIRQAASDLGVEGTPLLPRNGDDRVQTPDPLARAVVEHFMPCGKIVEPSSGGGAFLRALPKATDWFEIEKGRDFLQARGSWDWAVGDPPFSRFRDLLKKAMEVANNAVFIGLAPAWFVNARQEDMRQAGFALVELCALPVPKTWPQFGIDLTAGWARRGWQGAIAHTRLDGERGTNGPN